MVLWCTEIVIYETKVDLDLKSINWITFYTRSFLSVILELLSFAVVDFVHLWVNRETIHFSKWKIFATVDNPIIYKQLFFPKFLPNGPYQ